MKKKKRLNTAENFYKIISINCEYSLVSEWIKCMRVYGKDDETIKILIRI